MHARMALLPSTPCPLSAAAAVLRFARFQVAYSALHLRHPHLDTVELGDLTNDLQTLLVRYSECFLSVSEAAKNVGKAGGGTMP